ncbi:hypothetical protein CSAL01_03624 [Colletotrichum salicis]|uniref:Uncharacterized protein n=1 Tax=Colletotrichum salicis TaxID=1209931 RepID=A0A135V4K3_9PEZI|nr:hypothetical protein CSAL01_03624 [Colletotrichum salicis]
MQPTARIALDVPFARIRQAPASMSPAPPRPPTFGLPASAVLLRLWENRFNAQSYFKFQPCKVPVPQCGPPQTGRRPKSPPPGPAGPIHLEHSQPQPQKSSLKSSTHGLHSNLTSEKRISVSHQNIYCT